MDNFDTDINEPQPDSASSAESTRRTHSRALQTAPVPGTRPSAPSDCVSSVQFSGAQNRRGVSPRSGRLRDCLCALSYSPSSCPRFKQQDREDLVFRFPTLASFYPLGKEKRNHEGKELRKRVGPLRLSQDRVVYFVVQVCWC